MKKKLIVIAVGSALGAPALVHAQTSTVQVFGRIIEEYTFRANQGQGPAGERNNVDILQSPAGSEIGFKGEEKLGGTLATWFQCASSADVRGVNQNGFCSRNSGVGLKGAFGNIWAGIWDTPFKRVGGRNLVTSQTGIAGNAFMLMGGSTSVDGRDTPGLFFRRQRNSINYDSPNFSGFQLSVSTSATNQATNTTAAAVGAKPRVFSISGSYDNGPLNVGAALEQHKNFQPANPQAPALAATVNSGTDTGWLLTAGYQLQQVKLGAIYTEQKFETAPGSESKVKAWQLAADWHISGPHGLRASYTRAGDVTGSGPGISVPSTGVAAATGGLRAGTGGSVMGYRPAPGPNTGANLWQVRYVHTFSKRTEADFGYVKLNNNSKAQYALGGLSLPATGINQDAWFMTMTHRF